MHKAPKLLLTSFGLVVALFSSALFGSLFTPTRGMLSPRKWLADNTVPSPPTEITRSTCCTAIRKTGVGRGSGGREGGREAEKVDIHAASAVLDESSSSWNVYVSSRVPMATQQNDDPTIAASWKTICSSIQSRQHSVDATHLPARCFSGETVQPRCRLII